MALFDLSYHWRFDRDTYRWECWLLRHPAPETLCMSRVGWITAEAAAVAQIDVKAAFVDQLARQRGDHLTYTEV